MYKKKDLPEYYAQRAAEYEAIYRKPERQADLLTAAAFLQEIFNNRSVLEIACGTGYWTEAIARSAKNILATDINESVLDIARCKDYPRQNVIFETADLYRLKPEHQAEAIRQARGTRGDFDELLVWVQQHTEDGATTPGTR